MIDKQLQNAIKNAALELCCGDQTLRGRLSCAVRRLDRFLGRREDWPAALYSRSQDISDEFKGFQSAESAIEAMQFSKVERLAERILHLYADSNVQAASSEM